MVRTTRQREAIRSAFERADRPLSPGEALTLAAAQVPAMGISTVYRTIAALVDEGWLKTVSLPGQPDRYETAGRHHHHHFHCTICGGVFEVESCPGDFSSMAPKGFKVLDHEVILSGWCRACAKGSGKSAPGGGAPGHVHVAECLSEGCAHGQHAPGAAAPRPRADRAPISRKGPRSKRA